MVNKKLHEWIAEGRANGTIQDVATVIWAYCMDEQQALKWVAAIVLGQLPERDALVALKVDDCVSDALADLEWRQIASPPDPDMSPG